MKKYLIICLAACMLLAASAAMAADKTIRVGVLAALSGPTSDVGPSYANGIRDCANWLNETKYVPGHTFEIILQDYAYNAQQAITIYRRFTSKDKIVALQGWGTADTEALTQFVARDRVPTLSASYSAHLTDPSKTPYNFFISTDYTTQLRGGLQYLRDAWTESRAPRLALIYPDHPYGKAPIAGGKAFAREIGFEVVGEETVALGALDATAQLLAVRDMKPDFVWIGGTTSSTAVILKDAKKLDFSPTFLTNIWGVDENIFKLAGDAAEGVYTLQASAVYGADVPGMKIIEQATKGEPQMTHYIRGFASMLVMAEGARVAAAKGSVTGPTLKDALETLRDYDPMGLVPPVSFFPDDHRPSMSVMIYRIENGEFVLKGTPTLPRKAEWLGN
ncbi:ABC transporter substrate binding protein precursor [Alkalidesulfovibrio alkalitolerans DSM 16529]|uniref:ABC transporter substrate binding protein n=1 Tax=Alkalidesulfovibrio alkalitolerans DSM 16529 TaxID=1121439 RepID=S7T4F0_9BACT|nr:ABC transporter substrate-binding protein [Alkalidesulfovibrio alkalitolerans]EPR31481.1 ABC transporter substrate binding protein precursor [Alkalidesulfovibrio alkalitolerans DSM 16529]